MSPPARSARKFWGFYSVSGEIPARSAGKFWAICVASVKFCSLAARSSVASIRVKFVRACKKELALNLRPWACNGCNETTSAQLQISVATTDSTTESSIAATDERASATIKECHGRGAQPSACHAHSCPQQRCGQQLRSQQPENQPPDLQARDGGSGCGEAPAERLGSRRANKRAGVALHSATLATAHRGGSEAADSEGRAPARAR